MPFGHNSQSFLDVIDINGVNDRFLSILVDWMYEFYLMIDLPLDSNNDMPHVMARPFAVYKQLSDVFVLFQNKYACHHYQNTNWKQYILLHSHGYLHAYTVPCE